MLVSLGDFEQLAGKRSWCRSIFSEQPIVSCSQNDIICEFPTIIVVLSVAGEKCQDDSLGNMCSIACVFMNEA